MPTDLASASQQGLHVRRGSTTCQSANMRLALLCTCATILEQLYMLGEIQGLDWVKDPKPDYRRQCPPVRLLLHHSCFTATWLQR